MSRAILRAKVSKTKAPKTYAKRKQKNPNPTRWATGEFVALDGEGFSEGIEHHITMPSGAVYRGKEHFYAYLSASDGSEIYSDLERISLDQALAFICDIQTRNPRAIVVVFGGSYDVTHMVTHEITRDQTLMLLGKHARRRALDLDTAEYSYRLEYHPRKCLTIRRWELGARKYATNEKGERKLTPHLLVNVWDVWGFFQDSFVGVMKKWIPGDPDYQMISRMKGERSIFERSEIEQIKIYNAAELRCLVKIMNKVRDAIDDLGLKITRWDGAGAIAAAMMQKHNVRDHKQQPPPEVFDAARIAYSGGHIEVCKMGYHKGKVHHYDVNSAYPDVFRRLPSLSNGRWQTGVGPPPEGFTLVHLRYKFHHGREFYPLFFRCSDGSIIYPDVGIGWYWWPEYLAAKLYDDQFSHDAEGRRIAGTTFAVIEWWHFSSAVDERPFSWVEDYYTARQDYIREARLRGVESGPEKIIKLGCNSLYGKTAQQVGARYDKDGELKLPGYFQLDWAGYVTAGCRAKLMEAAITKPNAIIGFATDGLFSLEPLDLYCPDEKELGAWEYKVHDGITMVMPGVYWLHDGSEVKHYSRGFDKREMSDVEFIHDAWRRKQTSVAISITRLIGLGTACTSTHFWNMRGNFVTSRRTLCLDGDNSKRYPVMLNQCKPHQGLVQTWPRTHRLSNDVDEFRSAPYPIAWMEPDFSRDDPEGEWIEERDMEDAALS